MNKAEFIDWLDMDPDLKGLAMVTLEGVIAYEIAEHEAKQWHKYPEEKPNDNQFVIITDDDGDIISCFYNEAVNGFTLRGIEFINVIAWRELPKYEPKTKRQ